LLGEHAVVYGAPALAVALGCGVRARSGPVEQGPSRLVVQEWNIAVDEKDDRSDLARAFRALLDAVRRDVLDLSPRSVDVTVDLPPASGLGCSAAMGVAIARSIQPDPSETCLLDRAMAWERVFHGSASGVDAAVAARGGCLWFRKDNPIESVQANKPLRLCVGHTGATSSTRAMVRAVSELRRHRPAFVDKVFETIASLVSQARRAIEEGDHARIGGLMDHNQSMLGLLRLSTPEIDRMCGLARDAGALGAKLTGAGGGGSVVALAPSAAVQSAIFSAWTKGGYRVLVGSVPQGGEPVT
jgi:mevalonate kinase